jgi:histidinol phosphatase-like enzyme
MRMFARELLIRRRNLRRRFLREIIVNYTIVYLCARRRTERLIQKECCFNCRKRKKSMQRIVLKRVFL